MSEKRQKKVFRTLSFLSAKRPGVSALLIRTPGGARTGGANSEQCESGETFFCRNERKAPKKGFSNTFVFFGKEAWGFGLVDSDAGGGENRRGEQRTMRKRGNFLLPK